jgi:hypothetical protein
MSVQMQAEQAMCARCGHPAAGRFCANCGDRIAPQAVSVLGLAASDLFELDERRGFISIFWKILKQPITAATELAVDRQWHGHSAFFFFAVAVAALLTRLPETSLPQWMQPPPPDADADAFTRNFDYLMTAFFADVEVVFTYTWFAVTLWLGYRMFARRATVTRSARDYIKLSCIALGLTSLLGVLPGIPQVLGALRIISTHVGAQLYTLLLVATLLLSIAYIAMLNRVFWKVSPWRAALVTSFVSLIGLVVATFAPVLILAGLAGTMAALGY